MHEMRGSDAYFLREESRARHMHTLKIVVVDPAGANEAPSIDRVRAGALHVLPGQAAFRRRPLEVPAGIGNPFWIDAAELDPDYHVRHVELPAGSGDEALDELAGRVASEPLERNRPLWQIFFVEGLSGGRVAYLTKLHHAVADGTASAELVLRSFQDSERQMEYALRASGPGEPPPTHRECVTQAMKLHARRQVELPGLLWRSMRELGVSLAWRSEGRAMPASPFAAPHTCFNQPITPNRVCAHVRLPLSALREIKSATGCTVNDVYLTLVGGALRRYLPAGAAIDKRPLTAAVPVSVRSESDDPAFGNSIAYWFAATGSHLEDPVERLRAVSTSTRAARALFGRRDPRLSVDWLDHWVLRRLYISGLPSFVTALLGRPSCNVIVSNVRGPAHTLYSNGARVEQLYSFGPLSAQQGLNFTAWSYLDDFTVGIHACREHVPDVRAIGEALEAELDHLSAQKPGSRLHDDLPHDLPVEHVAESLGSLV